MQRKTVTMLVALLMLSAIPLNVSADEYDDIPTNATNSGVHDSLVAALAHADLVTTLQGDGPFTVFAPTDDAFAAAGIDLTTFDTDEENATLADILLYHVYSGAVNAADVTDGMIVTMVNGDDASFTVTDDAVMIGGATVTTADVASSNGVIHIIDSVLMPPADLVDIPTVAASTGVHTALVDALTKADLVSTLQGDGPFTVFAPTDQAFTDAGIDLDAFTTDEEIAVLADILLYHVYSAPVMASDVTDGLTVTMVNGDDASFTVADGTVMVGDATVTAADVMASNGVIHVIDKVLMPPSDLSDIPTIASGTGVHTALVAALSKADLVTTLQGDGPFTVFAPTDQAFTDAGIDLDSFTTDEEIAALADILLYHVYSGAVNAADVTDGLTVTMVNGDDASFTVTDGTVMVGDATVTAADVIASNGVIHVIDKVLMPPVDLVDIPTVADGTGIHTALVAALAKADLVATLQGDGPFTVFAPTDQAFTDAGIDLDSFTTDEEIAALANILLFHVYSGAVNAADVTDGLTVTMVNGDDASFTVMDGTVMVGDATVTIADVMASNGVVHVIDKVLMPPADEDVTTCDVTIGISSDGYAFSPASVTIQVNQTVCWQWTGAEMAHNVKEVDGMKSTTYVTDGITSGAPDVNVDFSYTFTEDTVFYYVCEPHMSLDMFGKVTVGDGGIVAPVVSDDKEEENTPGFLGVTMILATLGAVLYSRSNRDEEL